MQPAFSPLTSVHAANVLAWERSNSGNGTPAPQLDANYLDLLSGSSRMAVWRKALAEN
jgi:hypothetical protein